MTSKPYLDTEDSEEQSRQPTDDEIEAYKQASGNALFGQVLLALAAGGTSYAVESVKVYKFLKGPLDPKKLIDDPIYRHRVERAIQLAKRHERFGIKFDKGKIEQTKKALSQVDETHKQLGVVKNLHFKLRYNSQLRSIYGLSDKEVEAVFKGANQRIRENPKLSMQEALQGEARGVLRQKIVSDAKANKEKLSDKQIAERVTDKERKFKDTTSPSLEYEKQACDKILKTGTENVAQTLGVEIKPEVPSEQPAAPQIVTTQPPTSQPTLVPQPVTTPQPVISGPTPSIPKQPMPAPLIRPSPTPTMSFRIRDRLSGIASHITSPFKSLFSGLKNFGGLGNALKGLGGSAIKSLLRFNPAGLGITLALELAPVVITVIILLAVGLPLVLSTMGKTNPFSYITSKNPLILKTSVLENKTYSWSEFEKKFLASPKNELYISWQQFEKENIIPAEKYLSKNPE